MVLGRLRRRFTAYYRLRRPLPLQNLHLEKVYPKHANNLNSAIVSALTFSVTVLGLLSVDSLSGAVSNRSLFSVNMLVGVLVVVFFLYLLLLLPLVLLWLLSLRLLPLLVLPPYLWLFTFWFQIPLLGSPALLLAIAVTLLLWLIASKVVRLRRWADSMLRNLLNHLFILPFLLRVNRMSFYLSIFFALGCLLVSGVLFQASRMGLDVSPEDAGYVMTYALSLLAVLFVGVVAVPTLTIFYGYIASLNSIRQKYGRAHPATSKPSALSDSTPDKSQNQARNQIWKRSLAGKPGPQLSRRGHRRRTRSF